MGEHFKQAAIIFFLPALIYLWYKASCWMFPDEETQKSNSNWFHNRYFAMKQDIKPKRVLPDLFKINRPRPNWTVIQGGRK